VNLHFQDKFIVDANVQHVWELLTNIDEVRKIIPDLREYEFIDSNQARVVLGVGLGLMKGSFRMLLTIDPIEPQRATKIMCVGDGLQSRASIIINLCLEPLSDSTRIRWDADVSITGLIANVGTKIIYDTTKRKVTQIVEGISRVPQKNHWKTGSPPKR
jgi:carbon monoxide dehydrogenase subunit G